MGLFSDVDWLIIAAVAAFLLFGRENAQVLRTVGRWYGRVVHLKQELLDEVARAADLPAGAGGGSLRTALFGLESPGTRSRGVPAAVSAPPVAVVAAPPSGVPWTGGLPTLSWSVTGAPPEGTGFR